tara:strand:- start:8480 stop:8662 length:183 start_codon:yes stop_codon:yes gene_type:complete
MWVLSIFKDKDKKELLQTLDFNTINELGEVLELKPQIISNFYHNLIKARGVLEFITLSKR